jgi:hypothetical protein
MGDVPARRIQDSCLNGMRRLPAMTIERLLRLFGSACLMIVVLTHIGNYYGATLGLTSVLGRISDSCRTSRYFREGPINDIAQQSITLIGATVMQSSTAHAFRQYHQNTPTIPSTPAATKTKINAEFSIQAIAGMPSAMINPRRQICQERT